jgi:hypothetical protein
VETKTAEAAEVVSEKKARKGGAKKKPAAKKGE